MSKAEESERYVKMCTNSKSCSQERKTSDLGNMMVTSCTRCFHIFAWEIVPEKKKSVSEKSFKDPASIIPETAIDDATEKLAEEMKKVFADTDKILQETLRITSPNSTNVITDPEDYDPMSELNDTEFAKQERGYEILSVKIKSERTVRIICGGIKMNWFIDIDTDPEKVAKIRSDNGILIGKYIHVEYLGLDENQNPKHPRYVSIKKTA